MRLKRNAGRAVVISTALLGVLVGAVPALAGAGGVARSPAQSLGSGSWSAVATTASSAPFGSGALSLLFGVLNTQVIYFNVVNTGALTLTGATYTLSGTSLPGNSTLAVSACVGGTWNQATDTCVGGALTTVLSSTGAVSSQSVSSAGLFPAAPGVSVQLQVTLSKNAAANALGTIGVSVTRSTQVRAATSTNS